MIKTETIKANTFILIDLVSFVIHQSESSFETIC